MLTDDRPRVEAEPRLTIAVPPARRRTWQSEIPPDIPLVVALAVFTVASAIGLTRIFTGHGWLAPVIVTVIASHAAAGALRYWKVTPGLSVAGGLATVVMMVIWTVFGSTTLVGFPAAGTWTHVGHAIGDLGNQFSNQVAPLSPKPSLEMLAAFGGGLVALLSDWVMFRMRAPMLALLPGIIAFVGCCTSAVGHGRGEVIIIEVVAASLVLLVEGIVGATGVVWFAGVRSGAATWAVTVGAMITAAAVIGALVVIPAMSPQDGVGAFGWRIGNGPGNGQRIVPNPIVSLQDRLLQFANTPVFQVDSSVPSYWRLTSLDTFNGDTWTSTGSYQGFKVKLPDTPVVPPGARQVRATFQIQQLDSVWLPDQFTPLTVLGAKHISYDPSSDSLLTSKNTVDGMSYSVTSYQYLDVLDPAQLEKAPDPVQTELAKARPYTVVQNVDTAVTDLAQRITQGKKTELDKALALQQYLRGPDFKYSLNPPKVDAGPDANALYDFLFTTKEGFCQQFAGSFAVMARSIGLPTRLAVGFTTGDLANTGGYQVYDKDAHTWPEVYFGAQFGWLPFEPTPSFGIPGTERYTGEASSAPRASAKETPTTISSAATASTPTTLPTSATTAPPTQKKTKQNDSTSSRPHSGTNPLPLILLGVVAAVILWAAGNVAFRRTSRTRRRQRAQRMGTEAFVLAMGRELASDLNWRGVQRESFETDDEFARRVAKHLRKAGLNGPWQHGGPYALARLARHALFSPEPSPEHMDQARLAVEEIQAQIRKVTPFGQRVLQALLLPPGTWNRLQNRVVDRWTAGPAARLGRRNNLRTRVPW